MIYVFYVHRNRKQDTASIFLEEQDRWTCIRKAYHERINKLDIGVKIEQKVDKLIRMP